MYVLYINCSKQSIPSNGIAVSYWMLIFVISFVPQLVLNHLFDTISQSAFPYASNMWPYTLYNPISRDQKYVFSKRRKLTLHRTNPVARM